MLLENFQCNIYWQLHDMRCNFKFFFFFRDLYCLMVSLLLLWYMCKEDCNVLYKCPYCISIYHDLIKKMCKKYISFCFLWVNCVAFVSNIGTHLAYNHNVTCNMRLYLKIGPMSVKPRWKHWILTSNDCCLHTGVPYNTAYGWNRPNVNTVQCSLFTYTWIDVYLKKVSLI